MNTRKSILPLLALSVLLIGCQTLYTSVITITSVVDSAMKQWAVLSVSNNTTPSLDAAVTKAHNAFRASCGIAQQALITYKAGGDQRAYLIALEATRKAADALIEIIVPMLDKTDAGKLKTRLTKANAP